ncbi:putative NAD-P-binding protein [Mycena venus]|uniref:Putative NAD-P-binding protein n=1 Tax=Mycena venus TaxID=2733690 RepID=A0A8H7DCE7_9AGAR|nr:putative NAD-P-binding protein [Mycena venus]
MILHSLHFQIMSPQTQTWLVTGASNGMGLSVTEYLLAEGHNIVAAVRRPDSKSMSTLKSKYGARVLVVKVDVQSQEDVDTAFAQAQAHFGQIDVVYNNAGYSAVGEVEAMPMADAKDMFETNFFGATRVSLAAIKFFREVNKPVGGRLIQASSIYGLVPGGASGFYAASKYGEQHALEGITESMAAELDPAWNIKITLAEMGFFRTNFVKNHTYAVYTHPAYTAPSLLGNVTRAMLADVDPKMIKGDPDKLARRLYELAVLDDPPLHVMLGAEGPAMLKPKLAKDENEREKYAQWAYGLEFDE